MCQVRAWDSTTCGNFYILSEYTGGSSGALVLQRYKFIGSAPTEGNFATNEDPATYETEANAKIIYQWVSSGTDDQAYDPTMAVDDNLSSIPRRRGVAGGPYANNTSTSPTPITWVTSTSHGRASTKTRRFRLRPFNPNRITVEVSSDGGNNFSPATIAGAGQFCNRGRRHAGAHGQPGPAVD